MKGVLRDFRTKNRLAADSFRLGNHYIFGRQGAVPIRYEEIQQIYEHYRNRHAVRGRCDLPSPRWFIWVTTARGNHPLGSMPIPHMNAFEFDMLLAKIKSKNSNVQHVVMKRKSLGLVTEYEAVEK